MNQSKGLDLSKMKMSLVFIRKLVGAQLYFLSYMLMTFYSLGMISYLAECQVLVREVFLNERLRQSCLYPRDKDL